MDRNRLRKLLMYMLILGMGCAFIYYGFDMARYAAASADWPSVTGTVVRSGVTADHDTTPGTDYKPTIVVEFEVNGQSYACERVWFTPSDLTAEHAKETARRYSEGKNVPVYYHPDSPSISVLEPGAYISSYFLVIGGIVVILAAIGMIARTMLRA